MKSYLDTLERLGYDMPNKLGVSLILNSLNKDYDQFIQNYNMHSMGKTIGELHAMLKLHENGILKKTKTSSVLAIQEGKIQKDKKKPQGAKGKDKGKNKLAYDPKPKISPPSKRDNLAKGSVCHHWKEVGYWRRNYPFYQAELKKRKNAKMASTSGIFTIERYAFPNKTWVYDMGCGTHICNTLQGLRESRKLKHGALSLYMGNGMRAAVEAIGSFDLILPSGLIVVLDNFHFAPSVTRDVLISCLMARKPFPHQVEKAKDLLGLIHTDVYGPFRTVSREDASYFITFTADLSRYGYVYLMKHKHEVFETFKVFQNEVENQLGKKIKAIRSNRGGKYPSHKFVNHMKSCGIVSQLTLPYTPQHHGVSERRNQTLLDMVRSMTNLTTLLKSFWRYALEFASSHSQYGFNQEVPIRRSARIPQAPDRYGFYVDVEEYELGDLNEPPNYKATLSDPEFDIWLEAMNTEMQSIKDNQVWVLVDLPLNGQTFGSKWLFKKNTNMDGNVPIFKARLIAKGYTQTYGVDYEETFSPAANIRAIRILLAIVAFYDYEIWQMDVKIAFLNGRLSEDLYMVQPEGFVDPKHPNKCFSMKDLGEATYILEIKITRDRSKRLIALSQIGYLEKIQKNFLMENSKKGYTLMIEKPDYRKSQGAKIPSEQNPNKIHWTTVKVILKYLRNTKDMILMYRAKPEAKLKVSCYANASFQTDKNDTKSQTGYVKWYIVTAKASIEAVWIRKFIDGLGGVMPLNKRYMEMLCDNEPAIAIPNDPKILKGARHF
ncbi:retrotransposon protein, putative, ty1-copia subclass [Tanacetum coccineum]